MNKQNSSPGLSLITSLNHTELLPYDLYDMNAIAVETRDSTTMNVPEKNDSALIIAGFKNRKHRNKAFDTLLADKRVEDLIKIEITDDGWSEGWKLFFKPVILNTMQVITPWMNPPENDLQTIVIDPGMAFGTGGHATTKLILGFLEDPKRSKKLPDAILDVGTGSGVLAIACALMGADQITGIDIDPNCQEAVFKNAKANSVQNRVTPITAVPSDIKNSWPLVLANIQLAVFLQTANDIATLVEPNGELLISGILKDQQEQCIKLWPGFTVKEIKSQDEWIAISLIKDQI